MFGIDTGRQAFFELLGQCAALVVLGTVLSCDHNLADVAKVDLTNSGHGSFSVIAPFSAAQAGEQVLANRLEHLWWNFGLSCLCSHSILFLDQCTQAGNAVTQDDACQRALHLWKFLEQGITMYPTSSQALGLGSLWAPVVATWPVVVATAPIPLVVSASTAAISTATLATSTATFTSTIAITTAFTTTVSTTATITTAAITSTTTTTVASTSTTAAIAATALATSTLANELGSDPTLILARAENLECLLRGTLGLWRKDADNKHPVDGEFGVYPHDVANGGTFVQERAI